METKAELLRAARDYERFAKRADERVRSRAGEDKNDQEAHADDEEVEAAVPVKPV